MKNIVVGAGISGSIIARHIAENLNQHVTVFERREQIAGNTFDYVNKHGILVQKYGPHIFHTNDINIVNYIKQFSDWQDYKLKCMVFMNEKFTPSPFNFKTIDDYFSEEKAIDIKNAIKYEYGDAKKATIVEMLESPNEKIKEFARYLFENDYKLYTSKQWGISPEEIDISVLKRVPVLFSYADGYFDDKFEAMPIGGFTKFIGNILNHKNISINLKSDALEHIDFDFKNNTAVFDKSSDCRIIYTGAIDELFRYKFGHLPYRTLRFKWKHLKIDSYQDAPVVAYPQEAGYTRITEYSKLPPQNVRGRTAIAIEYPIAFDSSSNVEPYYPIPTCENERLYKKYVEEVSGIRNLVLCGRLAEYKYYNMDQAVKNAMDACKHLH